MIDQVDVEEEDDDGTLTWDGQERRSGPRDGVDTKAEAVAFTTEERARFIDQIAALRQRLDRYEPERGPAATSIAAARPAIRLPSPAVEQAKLRVQVERLRSELRVAEDAIREHIRQKMTLRRQLEEAHAGRGGRAGGGGGDAKPDTADADVADAATDAPGGVAPAAAVVGTGDAEQSPSGVAVERPVPAKSEPTADAAAHGPIRRNQKGGILIALAALGEATVEQLVAYTGSNRGAVAMNLKNNAARIDSWHIDGRRKAYRLKAG